MFLSRNKRNNVHPCKPQFYYIKVGFKGVKIIQARFRDDIVFHCISNFSGSEISGLRKFVLDMDSLGLRVKLSARSGCSWGIWDAISIFYKNGMLSVLIRIAPSTYIFMINKKKKILNVFKYLLLELAEEFTRDS